MNESFYIEQRARGFLNLALLTILYFTVLYSILESYWAPIFISLLLSILTFLLQNKKWFKVIRFNDENLKVSYPYNFGGTKDFHWNYSEINKVIYYEYMSKTPSHCKVVCHDKSVNRFDYNKKDTDKLFEFLKSKKVKVEYYAKETNQYRK